MCCLHTLIQWFLLDELGQETCTTEGQLEQESRENTDSQQATQKCIKGKKTGKSYLLQKHHLHRLCRQCPWGQFSVQGMSQPCHLNREGTRDSDIQDRSNKSKAKRQNNKKKSLTLGESSVIFSLGQHYDPLPLCVYFGQSLGFLGNFLNVLGLQSKYTISWIKCEKRSTHHVQMQKKPVSPLTSKSCSLANAAAS